MSCGWRHAERILRTTPGDPHEISISTRQQQLALAVAINPPVEPGAIYVYSDTNYILLGDILERATQQPLAQALRQQVGYQRTGLNNTWLETLEPQPAGSLPPGCINSSVTTTATAWTLRSICGEAADWSAPAKT